MKRSIAWKTAVFGAMATMALGLQAIDSPRASAQPTVTDEVKFKGTATLTEASSGSTQHFNLSFTQDANPMPPDATGGCFNLKTMAGCTLTLAPGATVTGCPAPSVAVGTFTITEGGATTTVTVPGNVATVPPTASLFVAGEGAFTAPGDKSSIPGGGDSVVVGELVATPNGLPANDPCNRDGMSTLSVTVVGTITVVVP